MLESGQCTYTTELRSDPLLFHSGRSNLEFLTLIHYLSFSLFFLDAPILNFSLLFTTYLSHYFFKREETNAYASRARPNLQLFSTYESQPGLAAGMIPYTGVR